MRRASLILLMLTMTGCTLVRYTSTERTLTVVDFHPGGESIALTGELPDVGSLDVNREQGTSADIISGVVDAATGVPGL